MRQLIFQDLHFLLYKDGVRANTCHDFFIQCWGRLNGEPLGRYLVKHQAVGFISLLCPLGVGATD